jgi:protein involved in polysaccharide export with SLBB domain
MLGVERNKFLEILRCRGGELKRIKIFYMLFMFVFSISLVGQVSDKDKLKEEASELKIDQNQLFFMDSKQAFLLEKSVDPDKYILGPGDRICISVITEQIQYFEIVISPTEDLIIPGIGIINVSGMMLGKVQQEIETYIKAKVFQNAKVSVGIKNLRSFKVQVIGAIRKPGFYKVTPVDRLDDLLGMAGGVHQLAREFDITIKHKDNSEIKVNFLDFFRTGNLNNNPTLTEGDQIIIPFANIQEEGIVIRGSITGRGYDIIEKNETLESYLWRQANFNENADLESVLIERDTKGKKEFIRVLPVDFSSVILKAGDQIDILSERGISVGGFVQRPGQYNFIPGYNYVDYISLAGGNTIQGDVKKTVVLHLDGKREKARSASIERGDVIFVPQNRKDIWIGQVSIIQLMTSISTLILTFIAAINAVK